MEHDVILEDVPDSDIELGSVALPRISKKTVEKRTEVRSKVPSFSFRKLRSKTFAQRHVYTVDLCKFLNLEEEHVLEEIAARESDKHVMDHLNRIYLRKKENYDSKGFKRHKFTKQTFQIYVEDFKRYEKNRQGKSFYDTIQEDTEEIIPSKHVNKDENEYSKATTSSSKPPQSKRDTDYLIPIGKSKRVPKPYTEPTIIDTRVENLPSIAPDLEFPDSSHVEFNSSPHNLGELPIQTPNSNSPDVITADISPEVNKELEPNENTTSPSFQNVDITPAVHNEYTRRSLRQRKFSQNHVYTVDLCGFLGLATRTELDSYSESGIPDEEIFRKLDVLYSERLEKNPNLKRGKFKFSNFASHLEHHTRKYQKHIVAEDQTSETFSSQIVEEVSSDEDASSSNDETDLTSVSAREKKRLKGVLPFSYLKVQGVPPTRRNAAVKHKIDAIDRVGLAKRRLKKQGASETFVDFIDDDDEPIDDYASNLENYREPETFLDKNDHSGFDTAEVSDSEESGEDSDMEMLGPYAATDSLFGAAEEDRTSGIDHMLSRSNRNQHIKSKSKKKKASAKGVNGNKGTSTWSTKAKRIYRRNYAGQNAKAMVQPQVPFEAIDNISSKYAERSNLPENYSHQGRQSHQSLERVKVYQPSNKSFSTHTQSAPEAFQGQPQKQAKEKVSKTASFYGVAPNLSIHSLSRAPQSYTTQLEAQSHKYTVKSLKNHSKDNLNPLEPPGIFTIPDDHPMDFPVEDSTENLAFESTPFEAIDRLHQNHKTELLQLLEKYLNLEYDSGDIDTISYKLDGVPFILSKINSHESPTVLKRSFNFFKRFLVQKKNNNQVYTEYVSLLHNVAKWLNCTKDISDQYAACTLQELVGSAEVLSNVINKAIHHRQQTAKHMLVLISLLIMDLIICQRVLQSHGAQMSVQASTVITKLVRSYLTYVFVCETPESFYNVISESDSGYYESLKLVGMVSKYLSGISFWTEVQYVFQKYGSSNEINRMVEYMRIFQAFTAELNNHWEPIISILMFTKKLVGYSQAKSTKLVIDFIFEIQEKWELDESVIVGVYGVLSSAKFKGFSGERTEHLLKSKIGNTQHFKEDSVLESYFKLLTIYSSTGKISSSLVEKIMPISSLDFEIQSDEVLINRVNVLLVYSSILNRNFSKQLSILLKTSDAASVSRLEIAFDSFFILQQMNAQSGKQVKLNSIRDVVMKFIKKFNSILTVKLDSFTIEKNGQFLQKICDRSLEIFSWKQVAGIELLKTVCELFNLKFHATTVLDRLLANVTVLAQESLLFIEQGDSVLDSESISVISNEFYMSLTALLSAQLSIFVPFQTNSYKVSNLMNVWCGVSAFLVSQHSLDWNSVWFYHWGTIAGSSQREYFELQLLETILDYPNFENLPIPSTDVFLKAFSVHVVKFNSDRIFSYLTKLIRFFSESNIEFSSSFNVDTKQQFESSRVQTVISYVYYLKKSSTDSVYDFKKSESLMLELLRSLDRELEIQNRNVTNLVWFCHFATKIVKFINYSCFELVKNSVEFSKLRSKLEISYHSDVDYAEKFKEKMSSRSLEQLVRTIELEMLSSLIQGNEAHLKFVDILRSLIVDQLYNAYQKKTTTVEDETSFATSPLYPLTVMMTSHLQILSTRGSFTNWFILESYIKITVDCILQKGSLSESDLLCLIKMIQNFTIIISVETTTQYCKIYKKLVMIKTFELMIIIYNLLSTYADQQRFSNVASAFIDLKNDISPTEIIQNRHYSNCIRILNEDLVKYHPKVQDMINSIAKDTSNNGDQIKLSLEMTMEKFKFLVRPAQPLYIEF